MTQHNILLVEDEKGVRKNIAQYLRIQNKYVIEAENGQVAYELFEESVPDLIITDISMPIMDGLSLIEKIRLSNTTVPIIVLSAHSDTEKLLRAVKLNLVDYIIKPINRANLKELIQKALHIEKNELIFLNCEYTFNQNTQILKHNNKSIELTSQQTHLMQILIRNRNQFISGENIFYELKNDYSLEYNSASVRNMIKRLRNILPAGIIKNIYGRGYMLSEIQENQNIQINIYDDFLEAIAIYNEQQELIYCNKVMLELFGYDNQKEVLGRSMSSFISPQREVDIQEAQNFDEHIINEIYLKRKDNSLFLAKTHSKNSFINGKYLRVLSVTDISKTIDKYTRDTLTSLKTRAVLELEFYNLLQSHHIDENPACALFIDIDNFKYINDTFGHQVGDAIIKKIAHALLSGLRKNDTIIRWGGDEFLIFLFDSTLEDALHIAENLRQSIQKLSHDSMSHFSCSFGIDILKENDTLDDIIYRIDTALLQAKKSNKNCIVQYKE